MGLIQIYDLISQNEVVFKKYTQIGRKDLGNKYSFLSTNSRAILKYENKERNYGGFYKAFRVINDVNDIDRAEWLRTNPSGQSFEKQHTVKMRESEFFMVRNNRYIRTSKGDVFKRVVVESDLSDEEKSLVTYILILSGYFDKIPNYIIERSKEITLSLNSNGVSTDFLLESILTIIKNRNKIDKKYKLAFFDYLYIDSFAFDFDGIGFLKLYIESTQSEKNKFQQYISQTIKQQSNKLIISKKFENGGNYLTSTLLENAWILYMSIEIINKTRDYTPNFNEFIDIVLSTYSTLFDININKVKDFINSSSNREVFEEVCNKLYGNDSILYDHEVSEEDHLVDIFIEEPIDTTSKQGRIINDKIMISLKRIAKTNSNHRCECTDLENCKYFTSKKSNCNYLEIHHLVPREFANDFDVSIEVISNYIPLCPNCHRKIHLGADRERKPLLTYLFSRRIEKLRQSGINISMKDLFKYYGCEY